MLLNNMSQIQIYALQKRRKKNSASKSFEVTFEVMKNEKMHFEQQQKNPRSLIF